ncbi:MAG: fatty acid desaturase family protein [Polyangiaceae bacterium]
MEIVLTDPVYAPPQAPGLLGRAAVRVIRDPRDLPFLQLMALLAVTVVPTGLALYVNRLFPSAATWWLLALVHSGLVIHFLGPFVLMLHNTSHRALFKHGWGWANNVIPWLLGPFFGESPETYFAHHVGMHHLENNLGPDLSTTLPFKRDSFIGFLRYFLRFFFFGLIELTAYFGRKKRSNLMWRCIVGELSFLALCAGLCLVSARATIVVFMGPFVVVRFAMMAGNWAQHAFIDQAAPENNYRNSITCINAVYNRRCFNDGYHISHHLKATRHWTEHPKEFMGNLPKYVAEKALVFEGIDFFVVWIFLMLKRYDWLANRLVQLGDEPMSTEDAIAMMRARTGWTQA